MHKRIEGGRMVTTSLALWRWLGLLGGKNQQIMHQQEKLVLGCRNEIHRDCREKLGQILCLLGVFRQDVRQRACILKLLPHPLALLLEFWKLWGPIKPPFPSKRMNHARNLVELCSSKFLQRCPSMITCYTICVLHSIPPSFVGLPSPECSASIH